jgi:hypothetical protein
VTHSGTLSDWCYSVVGNLTMVRLGAHLPPSGVRERRTLQWPHMYSGKILQFEYRAFSPSWKVIYNPF